MANERTGGMAPHLPANLLPLQDAGTMLLENIGRLADYQLDMMQCYTRFAMGQWRDALEIRDPDSFGEYLRKQNDRLRALGEKVSDDSRRLIQLSQECGQEALSTAERTTRATLEATKRGVEAHRRAEQGQGGNGKRHQPGTAAIDDYDELSAAEIEQRLETLDAQQIQQLLQHEKSNKNRKTLISAFERRL